MLSSRWCLLAFLANVACGSAAEPADEGAGPAEPESDPTAPGAAPSPTEEGELAVSTSVARRLSQAEFDNTVRDLLGDDTRPAATFLPEDEYSPYDNDYTKQRSSQALIDSIEALAEDVAARALTNPAARALIMPCEPTGPGDTACFRQVVEQLGRKLLRRPLSEEEVNSYLNLQAFATEDNLAVSPSFDTGVNLLLRTLLQDPEFLFRVEVGRPTTSAGYFQLASHEIATRLSYLLWGSTPDDELREQAEQDLLLDPSVRRQAAIRLLADDRAREQVRRFHAMWLGYRVIPHPPELVQAFNEETTRLIDRVVFDEPASYLGLFTAPDTYLTDLLANHYGLPAPQGGAGFVPYGASGRAGILSHGSVLAAFSKFSDTSPTQRGLFVVTRLLCNTIGTPPPTVDVDQPPGDTGQVCKEARYAAHRSVASCAVCHNQMDPIGIGLENYDVAGRYRSNDDGLPECAITGQGELPGYGPFSGPAELGQKLVDSGELEDCLVKQLYGYALGRPLEAEEQASAAELLRRFRDGGYLLTELLTEYAASEAFSYRKEPSP